MSIYKVTPAFPNIDRKAKEPGITFSEPVLDKVRELNEKMKAKGFDGSLNSCFTMAVSRGVSALIGELENQKVGDK